MYEIISDNIYIFQINFMVHVSKTDNYSINMIKTVTYKLKRLIHLLLQFKQ